MSEPSQPEFLQIGGNEYIRISDIAAIYPESNGSDSYNVVLETRQASHFEIPCKSKDEAWKMSSRIARIAGGALHLDQQP